MSIKQAIEALPPLPAAKTLSRGDEDGAIQLGYTADQMREYAIAALRSMPAEPVAWFELNESLDAWFLSYSFNPKAKTRPLYATPPTEAVRMSEAEIRRWWSSENGFEDLDMCKIDDFRTMVRAVEQATAARLGVKWGDV